MPFRDQVNTFTFVGNWNAVAGVYGIMNASKQMIYIGQTGNLAERMSAHQSDRTHRMHRYAPSLVWVERISDEAERIRREHEIIAEYDPPANRAA